MDAGSRRVKGKTHGYAMVMEMDDWCERFTYFLGRYYEASVESFVASVLREGDAFIDVGANLGMITLAAVRKVGPGGVVFAVEPNPKLAERVRACCRANGIANVLVLDVALSDERAERELNLFDQANGWSTLAECATTPETASRSISVRTELGDSLFPVPRDRPTVMKIDVEGYEFRALRGMKELLAASHPLVVTEVAPELLARSGVTFEDLYDFMTSHGYAAFDLRDCAWDKKPTHLPRQTRESPTRATNLAWVVVGSPYWNRMTKRYSLEETLVGSETLG
jgi:FkbM family methyltransferase